MVHINYVAILVSGVASMVIGSIWYGPLFGKIFMREMGMDKWSPEKRAEMRKSMVMTYVLQFIASMVMFYVLARFISQHGPISVMQGVTVALWTWIGFVVPVKLGDAIWGGNMTLFWIGSSNMLATLLASGAIIGALK